MNFFRMKKINNQNEKKNPNEIRKSATTFIAEEKTSQHFSITINIIFSEAELTDINIWKILFT